MRKKDIVLDFTSLLDVIMILLFIVISNTATASAKVSEEAQQTKDDLTAAEAEISDLEYRLQKKEAAEESYEIYTSEAVIVTMFNSEKEDAHILTVFTGENSEDTTEIPMGENNTQNTKKRIRSYIGEILNDTDGQPVYIVFRYDKYTIYRSEFEAVREELGRLSREHKEVFFKEKDLAEDPEGEE